MARYLFLLFLVVPIVEIGIFALLGDLIGFAWTMSGVVITAVVGSLMLRWQGGQLLGRIRNALNAGALPAREIVDGVMLAVAGALLLTPGYLTDTIGFLLFVPQVRLVVFNFLRARVKIVGGGAGFGPGPGAGPTSGGRGPRRPGDGTIDADPDEWRPRDGDSRSRP